MRHIATLLISWALCLFFIPTSAQIYHFTTKKIIKGQPGDIIWTEGIHNNHKAKFGTLIAKENSNTKSSKLIGIPIIYTYPDNNNNNTPIFILNGGPGESNLTNNMFFENLASIYPIVMIGYRGVDGSTQLHCPCIQNAINNPKLSLETSKTIFSNAADSCKNYLKKQLIDIHGYTTDEVINDIEAVRKNLNLKKINIVSFSFGTMLAQLYATSHPSQIDKNILIAPRRLFDFSIHCDDIARLDKQINTMLNPTSPFIIRQMIDNYTNIKHNINQSLYMLFIYSKLYSVNDINELANMLTACKNNNHQPLIENYQRFCDIFATKIVLGDVITKTTSFIITDTYRRENTPYLPISTTANHWFNASPGFSKYQTQQQQNSSNTLIICGDSDVVSSVEMIKSEFAKSYVTLKIATIKEAGHIDLLSTKRDIVENYIIHHLKN